jgi:hypothetical protein
MLYTQKDLVVLNSDISVLMLDEDLQSIDVTSATNSVSIKRATVKRQENSNFSAHLDMRILNNVNS